MSVGISIKAVTSKNNEEFKKHYNAVKFCLENNLSFPIETFNFFKGSIDDGDDLDTDIGDDEYLLNAIKDGRQIEIPISYANDGYIINISDIPKDVERLIIELT